MCLLVGFTGVLPFFTKAFIEVHVRNIKLKILQIEIDEVVQNEVEC